MPAEPSNVYGVLPTDDGGEKNRAIEFQHA